MNFLISSHYGDPHASLVAAALHREGHTVTLWDVPESSEGRSITVSIDESGFAWEFEGRRYASDHFDVIWPRRRRTPTIRTDLHEADREFAFTEVATYFDGLFSIAGPSTRMIHPPSIARDGESKLLQLATASRIGFKIPPSVIGNSRSRITGFIDNLESIDARAIYKTFKPIAWQEEDRVRMKHTSVVRTADIARNRYVEAVPGIYQMRIKKSHEVRATFFGDRELTVGIDSQRHPSAIEDWRSAFNLAGFLSPDNLPTDIRRMCRTMMDEMSLSIACFDFIVDEVGQFWFLELNQQGQFLWVEEQCEAIPMLDSFIDFMLEGGGATKRFSHSLADALTSPDYLALKEIFERERFVEISTDMVLPRYTDHRTTRHGASA